MTLNVVAMARGGASATGGGWFDGRGGGMVRLNPVANDAVLDVVIQFPEAISSTDYEQNGINSSSHTISSKQVSFQFQTIYADGRYRVDATTASGSKYTVIFQAHPAQAPVGEGALDPDDDDDLDGGTYG